MFKLLSNGQIDPFVINNISMWIHSILGFNEKSLLYNDCSTFIKRANYCNYVALVVTICICCLDKSKMFRSNFSPYWKRKQQQKKSIKFGCVTQSLVSAFISNFPINCKICQRMRKCTTLRPQTMGTKTNSYDTFHFFHIYSQSCLGDGCIRIEPKTLEHINRRIVK